MTALQIGLWIAAIAVLIAFIIRRKGRQKF
jgi:hypothetical protein